jgi:hypothetical protein
MIDMWFIIHEERGALCDYGVSTLDVHMGFLLKGPFVKPLIFPSEEDAMKCMEAWFSLVPGLSVGDTIPEVYLWEAA